MKRLYMLLIVLLSLAASVFGQSITFAGFYESGTTVFFPDAEKPVISQLSTREAIGVKGFLQMNAYNKSGTAGATLELRGISPNNADTGSLYFELAYAWLKFWDQRITVYGGKFSWSQFIVQTFRTLGGVDEGEFFMNDSGISLLVERLPFHPSLTHLSLAMTVLPHVQGQVKGGEISFDNVLNKGSYRYGINYLFPGKIKLTGMLFHNALTDMYPHNRFHGIFASDIHIMSRLGFPTFRVDMGFYDIQDDTYRNLKIGQYAVYRFAEKWQCLIRMRESFILGDKLKDPGFMAGYVPEFNISGYIQYTSGFFQPRLAAGYIYGGFKGNPREASARWRDDGHEALNGFRVQVNPTELPENDKIRGFDKDTAYFVLLPQISFRFPANAFVNIGGGPMFDLVAGDPRFNYIVWVSLFGRF